MLSLSLLIVLCYYLLIVVTPFSSELLKRHCDKEMKEGVMMMGQELTITNEYDIKVYRNEVELTNGSFILPNERLLVVIEPTIKQLVLEVSSNGNSYFENGKCTKSNRINSNKATLIISDDQSIIINGVIAKSYSSGVKLIKGGGFHLIQVNDNEEL